MRSLNIENIQLAANALIGNAVTTPLLESPKLNSELGCRLLVKAECLQRTGSFKFRGAYTKISRIPQPARARGLVAFSSGNHAQGVAATAGIFGCPATIIMPESAPEMKVNNTRAYGAKVQTYDILTQNREQLGRDLAETTGAVLVKPYDDPDIIAGQGTAGLEIGQQLDALGLSPDLLLCPCGGGGLIAGVSIAVHDHFPCTSIYAVEPDNFDDTRRSLQSGERETNQAGFSSICDAIITPTPGELTFAINQKHLSAGLTVDDASVLRAMKIAFEYFKIVVEPGGAVALAAALEGRVDVTNKCVVVVCSGGNVDPLQFQACLNS